MEKENITMQYISVWSWHIIAIVFLTSAFIVVFSGKSLGNNVMFVVFILAWVVCELFSLMRKQKLENLNGENENE